jgi:hypothetical protein
MGGAFVAVADDPTAVHWNPAGLATGTPAGMTIGWHRFQFGDLKALPVAGVSRADTSLTSISGWPFGLSYGRFQRTSVVPSEGVGNGLSAESLRVNHYGVTILQSVVQGLIVGSTLKYLRGFSARTPVADGTAGDVLHDAADNDRDSHGAFDLDVGIMADMRVVRLGLTLKNLRSPSFASSDGTAITLRKQARLGLAVLPVDGVTLAMDIDLDTVDLRDGLRRMFALGGESRLGSRLVVRSGVRWSLEGARRTVGAVGGSVGIRPGLWLDGHYAQGRTDEDREFGAALRAGF